MFKNDIAEMPKCTKFIIDTDAGCDDAHAIMCASYIVKHLRKDAEIIGITAVAGNASLDNVMKNVYITSRYCHFDNPPKVYRGCSKDTLRRFNRDNFFGLDGFGGVQEKYLTELGVNDKPLSHFYEPQHACEFIRDSIYKYGDDLCIICLGPTTNIYLTIQLYPDVVRKLGSLFAMGGTYIGVGNASNSVAEFNVATDVEATAVVYMAPFKHKFLLPFDVVLAYSFDNGRDKRVFENHQNSSASKLVFEMFQAVAMETGYYLCDQLTVILAMLPDLLQYVLTKNIAIVTDGMARGQVIVDWLMKLKEDECSRMHIVTAFDWDKVQDLAIKVNEL